MKRAMAVPCDVFCVECVNFSRRSLADGAINVFHGVFIS